MFLGFGFGVHFQVFRTTGSAFRFQFPGAQKSTRNAVLQKGIVEQSLTYTAYDAYVYMHHMPFMQLRIYVHVRRITTTPPKYSKT